MAIVILTLVGCWLIIGIWLSLDGVKKILPRIRATESVNWPALAFAFIAGMIWLPARFFRALLSPR